MLRQLSSCLFMAFGLSGFLFAQPTDVQRKEVAALYESYKKYVAQKNWVMANNFGRAILGKYPGTDAAEKVATELPEISKRAEAAHKEALEKQAASQKEALERQAASKKTAAEQRALQEKAIAGLRRVRDDVERISFYFAPNTSRGIANQWYLYIGVPDGGQPYLRFKWMYTDETWLFVKRITLSVDGEKVGSAPVSFFAVKRDNSGGRIWEWQDEPVNDKDIPFFRKLAASKKTIVRYEGDKYYNDRTLSEGEKKAFAQILMAYEGMRTKSSK